MVAVGIIAFVGMICFDIYNVLPSIPRNIRYGIPSLLFVNAFLVLENKINENNSTIKTCLKLGDASYAMYLFHPFVIYFLLRIAYPKIIGPSTKSWIILSELIFSIALVALVSMLIYEYVDKPTNRLLKKLVKNHNKPPVTF